MDWLKQIAPKDRVSRIAKLNYREARTQVTKWLDAAGLVRALRSHVGFGLMNQRAELMRSQGKDPEA